VRGDYDWYLLIGDETALPAIGRRLEELPLEAKAITVIEIADDAEQQATSGPASTTIHWVPRNGAPLGNPDLILDAVKSLSLPEGDGYIFASGESSMSKAVRSHFVDTLGHNPDWIKAAGYWQAGSSDFDDGHAH
jgi:NADPH-dependent ferric siderophore reductase